MNDKPFVILGQVVVDGMRKRFKAKDPGHLQRCLNKLPAGTDLSVEFSSKKPTRSQGQHRRYWWLLGLIEEHSGMRDTEVHHAFMVELWGETVFKWKGKTYTMRVSESDSGGFTRDKMDELMMRAEAECAEQGINIEEKSDPNYIPNY